MQYRIPPVPQYSIPRSTIVAPDSSLIYSHFTHICWLKVTEPVQLLNNRTKIWSIDCDPDWSTSKHVAVIGDDRRVWIWDLAKKAVLKGHSAHVDRLPESMHDNPTLALCYTRHKKVLSADPRCFVEYDVAANTYKVHVGVFGKVKISVLSSSPYDPDMFAAGTQHGLIMVYRLKTMEKLHHIRSFDKMIWSLDWIDATALAPASHVPEDLFGVYDFDKARVEFGITHKKWRDDEESPDDQLSREPTTFNEHFDYREACASLKHDIAKFHQNGSSPEATAGDEVEMAEVVDTNPTIEECQENMEMQELAKSSIMDCSDEDADKKSSSVGKESGIDDNDTPRVWLIVGSIQYNFLVWDINAEKEIDKIMFKKIQQVGFNCKNYIARWIDSNTFIANSPTGEIFLYHGSKNHDDKIVYKKGNDEKFKNQKSILDIAVDRNRKGVLWTVSFHHKLTCMSINDDDDDWLLHDFSTSTMRIESIVPSPIDPNMLAIGGHKRVSFLNVSQADKRHFVMKQVESKIGAQVISVAWHPVNENVLAFSTKEGRVGLIDLKKVIETSVLKNVAYKEVYCVTWAQRHGDEKISLYCCAQGKLFCYQDTNKDADAKVVPGFANVTSISAGKNYIAVGTYHGGLTVCNLDQSLSLAYTGKPFQKMVCCLDWKNNKLAATSYQNSFFIYDFTEINDVKCTEMVGHDGAVYYASWNKFVDNRIVSGSQDYTARVWDTTTQTCLHTLWFEHRIYVTIFHPTLEHHIIVGGNDFPLTICDYREAIDLREPKSSGKNKPHAAIDFKEAQADLDDVQAKIAKEKKRNRRRVVGVHAAESSSSVEKNVEKLSIDESSSKSEKIVKSLQFNYTTFLCLTNKELNRDPIATMQKILRDRKNGTKEVRHDLLLAKDHELNKQVFAEEYRNHQISGTDSVGNLALPMLLSTMKETILEKIESKSLSEEYVALAPSVSYSFWKNTCAAFALQCVEKHEILRSINYFLIADQPQQAIDALCAGHFYAEATAVAQTRRPVAVDRIVDLWVKYLETNGNYEAAAIVLMAAERYAAAVAFLELRNKDPNPFLTVIEELKSL